MQLGNGEYIVEKIKKHWICLVFPLIIGILFGGLVLPLIWAAYMIVKDLVEEVVLTNRQFYIRTGVMSKKIFSVPLKKINNVNYEQGFLGRILGYGTIYIQSGASVGGENYSYIANPEKVKTAIEQAIAAAEDIK